ncbi:hypothetical protein DPMN_115017 [Dreissena polymorpha]|uniref:Uncharacterized protein n=1 Tax=Dreissena polymorpha TaxID=45954 RepID=A0A9D4KKY8_DREPO|nr:hypothetical protein DPMN_115017 [Dreissena polymorpha]
MKVNGLYRPTTSQYNSICTKQTLRLKASYLVNGYVSSTGCALLTGVEQQVVLEVRLLAESPVADITAIRPRSVMHVHMRAQVPGRREGLVAKAAFVGLILKIAMRC